MYLVLSLGCTALNELVATIVGMRAKTLESTLAQLIDVPQLKADFYNHGLIDGAKIASNGNHPSYLPGRTFAMALLGSLDPVKPIPAFADIEDSVRHLPDSNVRDMLLANLTTAQGRLKTLRDGIATRRLQAKAQVPDARDRLCANRLGQCRYDRGGQAALAGCEPARTDGAGCPRDRLGQRSAVTGGCLGNAATGHSRSSKCRGELRPLPVGWDFGAKFDYWNWHGLLKLGGLP